jgi:proteic killer suppression protein
MYDKVMIKTFAGTQTEALFSGTRVRRWINIEAVARRKLVQLHAATALDFLRVPPGNRLQALRGDRAGQYSIRVNAQFRLCFTWRDGDVYDVEIVDYH